MSAPSSHRIPTRIAPGRWLTPVHGGIAPTSQTFAVAGRVMLCQIVVPTACAVDGLSYPVGSAANGSVIGGLIGPVAVTADSAAGAPVVAQSASTLQSAAGSTNAQFLSWTAVWITPGIYYGALEGSDITGTFCRQSNQAQALGLVQYYDRGSFGALTATTPAVTDTGSNAPGMRLRIAA